MRPTESRTILLIHGLWLTPRSWEKWIDRFTRQGHTVIAPAWPGLEAEVESLRRDPRPLEGLSIRRILEHYERIIRGLDALPIIMGHSFGGLFTQLLIDRGLGVAGVPISAGQTAGVLKLPLDTLRTGWPVLHNPFNYNRAVPLTPAQFNWRFTNELSAADSKPVYDRYYVPAAGRVFFDGVLALLAPRSITRVDYRNGKRAPMLFIAGSNDHVVPSSVNRANVKKYAGSGAITEYREFARRTHNIVNGGGWEEVADYALDWAVRHSSPSVKLAAAPVPAHA
jgi:pimeloyl-ACP methyl ester carboxylesterase